MAASTQNENSLLIFSYNGLAARLPSALGEQLKILEVLKHIASNIEENIEMFSLM